MLWIDVKYAHLLKSHTDRFSEKTENVFQFRCPFCGDSKKNKYKARGYLFPDDHKQSLKYLCHNCGVVKDMRSLLAFVSESLHNEYKLETMKNEPVIPKADIPISNKSNRLHNLIEKYECLQYCQRVDDCDNLEVKEYLNGRKVPEDQFFKFWFTDNFKKSFQDFVLDKTKIERMPEEPRLLFPFWNFDGRLMCVQGRKLNNDDSQSRFTTATFEKGRESIFGLNEMNKDELVYITEGPIDSVFLPNAIAMGGISHHLQLPLSMQRVWVLDNEPKNKEVLSIYRRLIRNGESVVIWKNCLWGGKDINDMVMKENLSREEIISYIKENTYSGPLAQLNFSQWIDTDLSV